VSGNREEQVADRKIRQAWREAEVGNTSLARKAIGEALKLKPDKSARALAALVLARIGDSAEAGK
jgi:hypothetical protein